MNCVFCENNREKIKERIISENDLAFSFVTNIPITEGHTLISSKRCVSSLEDLNTEERIAILNLADQIISALKNSHKAEGFNCVWNEGKLAGQSVPHFHLHIIPRKEGDTGLLGYDPRSMLYRTGDREESTLESLLKTKNLILSNFNKK